MLAGIHWFLQIKKLFMLIGNLTGKKERRCLIG
jgi:hypothetical protein